VGRFTRQMELLGIVLATIVGDGLVGITIIDEIMMALLAKMQQLLQ
jgi:hypothetical protein